MKSYVSCTGSAQVSAFSSELKFCQNVHTNGSRFVVFYFCSEPVNFTHTLNVASHECSNANLVTLVQLQTWKYL